MGSIPTESVTVLLEAVRAEEPGAAGRLFALVYGELRRMAAERMGHEPGGAGGRGGAGQTLQPTALVHEVYLRLMASAGDGQEGAAGGDARHGGWQNRAHFFGAAARAMRQVLVDGARRRGAVKRGGKGREGLEEEERGGRTLEGPIRRVPLDAVDAPVEPGRIDWPALDAALVALERRDARMHEVVMLRFFAGLSVAETAQAMSLSERTVKGEWRCARAWLHARLGMDTAVNGAGGE